MLTKRSDKMSLDAFTLSYDATSDVVHLRADHPEFVEAEQDDDGLLWVYPLDSDDATGVTIMNFHEIWLPRIDYLAGRIHNISHWPTESIALALKSVPT